MACDILILDPDRAFATMLGAAIEELGPYRVAVAPSLAAALEVLQHTPCTLAIADPEALSMGTLELARQLRSVCPALRLMVVPGEGEDITQWGEAVQGTLPKPFFMGELAERLEQALRRPWPPRQGGERRGEPLRQQRERLSAVLWELNRESLALGTCLLAGGQVLAEAGALPGMDPARLAQAVAEGQDPLFRIGQAVGEEAGFGQAILEGDRMRLHLVRVAEDVSLVVLSASSTPLGTLRYAIRHSLPTILRLLPEAGGEGHP